MVKTNLTPQIITSNRPSGGTNELRSIKAPVSIPNTTLWLISSLALLIVALLAWWFWRRRRPASKSVPPPVVIPPHQKAFARLREALSLIDQPLPFCTLVSDTLRVYLEERFQLRAPERTTEEFLEELQSSPLLTHDHKRALGEFLTSCDLVKFARYEPGRGELQALYDAALRLVEETQSPVAPPPPAPSQLRSS